LQKRKARPPILPIDVSKLKTYPLSRRHSKVQLADFATPWRRGGSLRTFLNTLPDILGVKTLRAVSQAIVKARRHNRPVIVGMGAHVTKVGLNPILVDLMERDIVTAVAMNGAVIIHDFELAMMGHTSEEVDAEIDSGRFGMAEETGRMLNEAIVSGVKDGQGIGEAVGAYINLRKKQFPHHRTSLLAVGERLGIPVTVHVAVGTDIIHMHPAADGAAIGAGSLLDFRTLAAVVAGMEGGVYLNLGIRGDPAGSLLENSHVGAKPGLSTDESHDGQYGFPFPLSPTHERRQAADPKRRARLFADGSSRDYGAAISRRHSRAMGRTLKKASNCVLVAKQSST
jgi:hypothetical protein